MQKLENFANKARRSIGDARHQGNGSSAELPGNWLAGERDHGDGDMKEGTTLSNFHKHPGGILSVQGQIPIWTTCQILS